jgi:putative component of toxin-antitoxin plasmid stabilization module
MELREFLDERDRSPFRAWFRALDAAAAARINAALVRLEIGNTSNVKGVGGGGAFSS